MDASKNIHEALRSVSAWNHKRVHRVYKAITSICRDARSVGCRSVFSPMAVDAEWSLDHEHTLYHGPNRFRTLNILDEGVREALDIVIDMSIPGGRVVRTLDHRVARQARFDNGQYISHVFDRLAQRPRVTLNYIQPGKPNQNAYIERFNRTYR